MKSNSNHRIVLCRLGGIGDVVHTLPLAEYLKRKYPDSKIEYITSENVGKLLTAHCPFIDCVWIFNSENKKKLTESILSRGKIDYFFNLHNSLSFFSFGLFYIRPKKYFQYKKDTNLHAVVNFARTYDKSVCMSELKSSTLYVNDVGNLLDKYDLKASQYVCFVPGVGKARPNRAWPFEKWISLAKKLLNHEKDLKLVFLGGKDEQKMGFKSVEDFKNKSVNLTGVLDLSDVAKIISRAKCLISCDTGLLHLACALSKKVIGLYGPTLPERSGPFTDNFEVIRASGCECKSKFKDVKSCKKTSLPEGYCMNNLNVEDVSGVLKKSYNKAESEVRV